MPSGYKDKIFHYKLFKLTSLKLLKSSSATFLLLLNKPLIANKLILLYPSTHTAPMLYFTRVVMFRHIFYFVNRISLETLHFAFTQINVVQNLYTLSICVKIPEYLISFFYSPLSACHAVPGTEEKHPEYHSRKAIKLFAAINDMSGLSGIPIDFFRVNLYIAAQFAAKGDERD